MTKTKPSPLPSTKPKTTYTGRVVGLPSPYRAKLILEWLTRETLERKEREAEKERMNAYLLGELER